MTVIQSSRRFGVAAASLGMHPSHTLETKFAALNKVGVQYAELGFEGYMTWVRQQDPSLPASTAPPAWSEGGEPDPADDVLWKALHDNVHGVKELANKYGVTISVLQPLNQFEGWPAGSERGEWTRRKAEKWLPLCSALGVEFLQVRYDAGRNLSVLCTNVQVGSNDQPDAVAPMNKYAEDLHWLADLASKQNPPVKIAYESWCFSQIVNSWEQTWEIVKAGVRIIGRRQYCITNIQDHPNLGLCLDVAHFPLAPQYGYDPLTGEGFNDKEFQACTDRIKAVPADKIFYVELADVVKPTTPLGQGSLFDEWRDENKPTRGDRFTWAVCGRPVPLVGRDAGRGEDIGGARVIEAVQAILATGFNGLFMYEQFEAQFQAGEDATIPERYASACAKSWTLLNKAL